MGSLRVVSGASFLPLTLDQAKEHLRVNDTSEDSLITTYMQAATAYAESFTGLAFVDQTFEYTFDAFPNDATVIQLPRSPLLEVINFESEGAAVASYTADAISMPARLYLPYGSSWPTPLATRSVGRVVFRAGLIDTSGSPTGEVPADILSAILLIIGTLYMQRETVVIGVIATEVPWSADQLLRRHRLELSMA